MTAVYARLIDLVIIGKHRPFTAMEAREYEESRRRVTDWELKRARLLNLLYAARTGRDWSWHGQLVDEYEAFMGRG